MQNSLAAHSTFRLNWDWMPSVHCQTRAAMIGFSIKLSYAKPANVLPNSKKEDLCLKIKAKCFSYFYRFTYVCV